MHFLSPFTTDFYFISQLFFYICFTTVKAAWIKEQNFQKDKLHHLSLGAHLTVTNKSFQITQDILYG